jgi:hypothetical protein
VEESSGVVSVIISNSYIEIEEAGAITSTSLATTTEEKNVGWCATYVIITTSV